MTKMNSQRHTHFFYLFGTLLLILELLPSAHGYGSGAPLGEACRTLYPGHGVDKQYGRSSYRVSVTSRLNETSVVVTIYSPVDTFLGFILQARLHSDREMLVNGQFMPDQQQSQALNCLGGYQNTLTHTNAYPKYKIEAVWNSPKNFAGEIIFRATVVQSKNFFWTAIDSDPIMIGTGQPSTFHNSPYNVPEGMPAPPVPSGFIVNKDNMNSFNTPSPYHVAMSSAGLGPQSSHYSQQPLVQRFPLSSHDSGSALFYLDYNVCSRKLCFGLPVNCMRKKNCIVLLTASLVPYSDATVEFEIIADHKSAFSNKRLSSFGLSSSILTTSAYYSMALSHDKVMGNDSVTDCALLSDGRPQVLHSLNTGKSNEELAESEFHGDTVVNASYTNGILYCKWRKRRRFTVRGTRYDLKDHHYNILMAYGRMTSMSTFRRKEPHMDKVASDSHVNFRSVGFISAHSKMFLVKIHAAFMIISWIGLVSIGIITARYFKPLWLSHSMFGVRIWFAVHRSIMTLALIFIVLSAISIFIYTESFIFGLHQTFGLLALIAAVINPIGALFRPECESENRWVFNWIHWLIGNTGHICAITAIFLAYQLPTIRLQPVFLWALAFYLFFHLTVHCLLQLYFCNCRNTKDTSDITVNGSIASSNNTSQQIDSLADTSFLRYFFIFYSTVIVAFVITLIILILVN